MSLRSAVLRTILGLGIIAVGVALGVVAERRVLDSAADELIAPPDNAPPVFSIDEEQFGSSIPIAIRVTWRRPKLEVPLSVGIVTSVDGAGSTPVDSSLTPIAKIAQTPILAAVGGLPWYRDVQPGDTGTDVEELQAALSAMGALDPSDVDGEFGPRTLRAVRRLYEQNGSVFDGVLRLGTVLFLPDGSQPVVESLVVGETSPPTLEVRLPSGDAASLTGLVGRVPGLKPGLGVFVDGSNRSFVVSSVTEVDGEFELALDLGDCGSPCVARLSPPSDESSVISGELELEPPTTGLAAPVSALFVDADGQRYLVSESGERVDVNVVRFRDGLALVENPRGEIKRGDRFRISPGES